MYGYGAIREWWWNLSVLCVEVCMMELRGAAWGVADLRGVQTAVFGGGDGH